MKKTGETKEIQMGITIHDAIVSVLEKDLRKNIEKELHPLVGLNQDEANIPKIAANLDAISAGDTLFKINFEQQVRKELPDGVIVHITGDDFMKAAYEIITKLKREIANQTSAAVSA
jgi:hypothetical protein